MSDVTKQPKIAVGCAGILVFVCFVASIFISLLPVMTSGRASRREVFPAQIGSGLCCTMSMFLLVGAIVWLFMSMNKNKNQGGPVDGGPGAPMGPQHGQNQPPTQQGPPQGPGPNQGPGGPPMG